MRIVKEQTAALVVDYQEKLVPAMENSEALIRNSKILLEGLRALGIPMVITQQYTKGLGMTVSELLDVSGCVDYVDKISFSAYDCVIDMISEKKFVIVCGIEAHICVLQTVIDLAAAGFVPVVVADCVDSRKASDKLAALERARMEGAIVTTYESLLFELLQVAGSDLSRKIQKLIR